MIRLSLSSLCFSDSATLTKMAESHGMSLEAIDNSIHTRVLMRRLLLMRSKKVSCPLLSKTKKHSFGYLAEKDQALIKATSRGTM